MALNVLPTESVSSARAVDPSTAAPITGQPANGSGSYLLAWCWSHVKTFRIDDIVSLILSYERTCGDEFAQIREPGHN